MTDIFIDIETYSSEDISKTGHYKYAEADDFEVLLFGYAIDDGPVVVLDFTSDSTLPSIITSLISDPDTRLLAHNAAFERICLSKISAHFNRPWHCTAVLSSYLGLPMSLKGATEATGLAEKGAAKDGKGQRLIRYFCKPCKPTKMNGGRPRNLPGHDPEKWSEFIDYCRQDVDITRRLYRYLTDTFEGLPEQEHINYLIDQAINDNGVSVDQELVVAAVAMDKINAKQLLDRIKDITSISNPNSPEQLKTWLSERIGKEVKTIAKAEALRMINEHSSGPVPEVAEVLQLRLRAARSSIKKYTKIQQMLCEDGRIRGLLQFYGAGRTGRWAGRGVQVQNLKRTHIKDIDVARTVVKDQDATMAEFLYGVSNLLSQMIRTALVAGPGRLLVSVDFSAIEARVLAWLAGEQWRLDVFSGDGRIYEASASKMFNVPIDQITKGSDYRAKGKVAELALGYQGSVGALTAMGGEAMGLEADEMMEIVRNWRRSNSSITQFWYAIQDRVLRVIANPEQIELYQMGGAKIAFKMHSGALQIILPNRRALYYQNARIVDSSYGPKILYDGVQQDPRKPGSRKWGKVETYGGKLTENIVQAIARDLLAQALLITYGRWGDEDVNIVMHVHDEVVLDVPEPIAGKVLTDVSQTMSIAPSWAEGLPLGADGYISKYYKKD